MYPCLLNRQWSSSAFSALPATTSYKWTCRFVFLKAQFKLFLKIQVLLRVYEQPKSHKTSRANHLHASEDISLVYSFSVPEQNVYCVARKTWSAVLRQIPQTRKPHQRQAGLKFQAFWGMKGSTLPKSWMPPASRGIWLAAFRNRKLPWEDLALIQQDNPHVLRHLLLLCTTGQVRKSLWGTIMPTFFLTAWQRLLTGIQNPCSPSQVFPWMHVHYLFHFHFTEFTASMSLNQKKTQPFISLPN